MANKKKIEERIKKEKAKQTERIIQWVGGGVIALVVVGLIWYFVQNGSSNQTETPPLQDVPTSDIVPTQDTSSATEAPQTTPRQYAAYPPMTIDPAKKYFATVKMAKGGEFVIQLYPDKAPKTVNSFVFLAREHFFDGVTFHRVLEGFMAQGGDPTGTGGGGPGYEFEYEPNDLKFDKAGVVAMANTGPATPTNGSQFFITFGPTPNLDGGYTIFGQVTEGMDVVNGITRRDPDTQPTFEGDAMESVTITEQ